MSRRLLDPYRGEIWLVRLDPSIGDEIGKTRPAIVVSDPDMGRLALRLIVPVTDWKPNYATYPWMTRLDPNPQNNLTKISAADSFQTKSVSLLRFINRLGECSSAELESILDAIAISIGYQPHDNKIPVAVM